MTKKTEKWNPKIIHVMADGTVRDSMKGVVIPLTPETEGVYRLAMEHLEKVSKKDFDEK